MDSQMVLKELGSLGTERTKKTYMQQGAREPLYGVATGAMKPIAKKIKKNQALAEELYSTGNYDAMYLAGMIVDSAAMSEADFDRWMESTYFYMISLHEEALSVANAISKVDVYRGKTKCSVPIASDEIQKAAGKGRLGFKRKNVRC
ncbi:MAG: DNA alkylation repair protein [Lachnospiraceae bacterium]